jgi:hypothetical protein
MLTAGMATLTAGEVKTEMHLVPVCISNGPVAGLVQAKMLAMRMFRTAGVRLEWYSGLDPRVCPAGAIQIIAGQNTKPEESPGVLAYAVPDGSKRIQVFCDRIAQFRYTQPKTLMAHLLVHEITHILQGVSRHSETGIMKAKWEVADYDAMTRKPLSFTATDIELIHRSLEKGAATVVEGSAVMR